MRPVIVSSITCARSGFGRALSAFDADSEILCYCKSLSQSQCFDKAACTQIYFEDMHAFSKVVDRFTFSVAVGINTAIYSTSGTNSGIGFAIPVDTIKLSVEQILQYGKVTRYNAAFYSYTSASVLLQKQGLMLSGDSLPFKPSYEAACVVSFTILQANPWNIVCPRSDHRAGTTSLS